MTGLRARLTSSVACAATLAVLAAGPARAQSMDWASDDTLTEQIAATLDEAPLDSDTAPEEGDLSFPQVLIDDDIAPDEPIGEIRGGLVYDETLGTGALFGLRHRDPFRAGIPLEFTAKVAQKGNAAELKLFKDGMAGPGSRGFLTFRYRDRDPFDTYETSDGQLDLGLGRVWERPDGQLSGRLGLRYRDSAVDDVPLFSSSFITEDDRQTLSLAGRIAYTGGSGPMAWQAGLTGEIGQRTGDSSESYSRAVAHARMRYRIGQPAWVTFGVKAGQVSGDDLLVSERFLGGEQVMRGFEYGGIGPRDTSAINDDALGGESFAGASLQVDTTLARFGIPNWTVGAFVDWGSVWGLSGGPAGVDDDYYLRSAGGISVGWQLDNLRLQVDISEPIQERDEDISEALRLTLTARF